MTMSNEGRPGVIADGELTATPCEAEKEIVSGADKVERVDDGRLKRIVMIFGPLTSRE